MLQRSLLIAAPVWAFLFIVVAVAEQRAVVPVSILFALVCLACGTLVPTIKSHRAFRLLCMFCLASVLWAGLSLLWAPMEGYSLSTVAKFTGSCVVGLVICGSVLVTDHRVLRRLIIGSSAGFVAASAYIIIDILGAGALDHAIFGYVYRPVYGYFWLKPTVALLTLVAWPLAYAIWRIRRNVLLSLIPPLTATCLGYAIGFHASIPAFILALGCCGAVCLLKSRAKYVIAGPLLMAMLLMPLPLQHINPSLLTTPEQTKSTAWRSVTHRLLIWEFTSHRIAEKPLLGTGIAASRHYGETAKLHDDRHRFYGEAIPIHPHNGPLQIWLELGAVGTIIAGAMIYFIVGLFTASPVLGVGIAAGGLFGTAIAYFLVSFNLWSSWWLQYLWFVSALMVASARLTETSTDKDV